MINDWRERKSIYFTKTDGIDIYFKSARHVKFRRELKMACHPFEIDICIHSSCRYRSIHVYTYSWRHV